MFVSNVHANQRFLLEGIADLELYNTDSQSLLLSRNEGDPSTVARLQFWSAYQVTDSLQIYGLGELETENSTGSYESELELEQLALRYTRTEAPYLVIEVGRILTPNSVFSQWHLSTKNPLIGQIYTHPTTYPEGIQVTGSHEKMDYRAALVDLPNYNEDFFDFEPGSAYRPVLGFGFTPVFGLRLGALYTEGPYLSSKLNPSLPAGSSWRDFDQRAIGFDIQYSRGYFELNGEWVTTDFDLPGVAEGSDEESYFLEVKYTFSPRFYAAARLQGVDGLFLETDGQGSFVSRQREFTDLEVGLGYRINADLVFKISYRTDHWRSATPGDPDLEDGRSVALQLSYSLDPRSWKKSN